MLGCLHSPPATNFLNQPIYAPVPSTSAFTLFPKTNNERGSRNHELQSLSCCGPPGVAKWRTALLLAAIVAMGWVGRTARAADAEPSPYARPYATAVAPALLPLPPGAVEPAGWLRDWALAAGRGITGHLDEYSPTFRDAWKGTPVNGPGAVPNGTGWPLEQCSYWLDGLLRLGLVLHDDALIGKATRPLGLVVNGVNRGGPSFIYWIKDKPHRFNSWAHSQMGRALVAWYQATGQRANPRRLGRAYADYPVPLGTCDFDGDPSGLCNLDAMLETYWSAATGA